MLITLKELSWLLIFQAQQYFYGHGGWGQQHYVYFLLPNKFRNGRKSVLDKPVIYQLISHSNKRS